MPGRALLKFAVARPKSAMLRLIQEPLRQVDHLETIVPVFAASRAAIPGRRNRLSMM
jgi:hypothetical protein